MNTKADAVILGGGIMGCSILYNLAAKGMTDTILLEKNVLGSGSTGRSMGIIRMHYSNEVTTLMALESLKIFQEFDQVMGNSSGYTNTGYLLIAGERDRHALEANLEMQRCIGVKAELLSPSEIAKIAPALSVGEDEIFAYEPESGYADPYAVTIGYARRAQDLGASIQTDTIVEHIEISGGRVTKVVTPNGSVSTPVVVVAAGPWSKPLLESVGIKVPLQTVRHQVMILRRPEDRVPDHLPFGDLHHSLSARPYSDGQTLLAVGEDDAPGPESYVQGVDITLVEEVMPKLASRMPGMSHAFFRGGWSGLFTTTPDWHPILDRVAGVDGLYCAVGFSGHGFKLAPMVGVVMAEMMIDNRTKSIDVSMLGLNRFEENRLLKSRYRMRVLA